MRLARDLYIISLMFSLAFFLRGSNNIVITTFPLFVKHYFDFTTPQVGILAAFMSGSMFFASGIVNPYLPQIRKLLVRVFSILYSVTLISTPFLNGATVWIASVVVGFAAGIIFPNVISMSSEIGDRRIRERAISLYTVALSLSLVVGPYIEYLVLKAYPLKDVFLVFAPFGIAVSILSFYLKVPSSNQTKVSTKIVKSIPFILAVINNTSYDVPFAAITSFGGILEVSRGIPAGLVAVSFAVYFTTSFFSRLFIALKPVKRIFSLIFISLVIASVGLFSLSFSQTFSEFLASMAILGIPHGLTYPVSLTVLSRGFSKDNITSANSLFFSLMSIVAIITPIIVGGVSLFIGLAESFLALESLVIISIIAIIILKERASYLSS
ncbi:MFS transporter [Sulfuracidifex tepidarius]|uniref:Multidrug resistance protein MdtL n=1 Tax=Sulfuracidifex tepidarius TaxID=1294262 RepID=A0A510E690_9CREN|nr:MFS transporter [Sulfuracidifex tepidarius]BBG27540.1 Multidrug resistance protein MdtL [Sulfuracidifex tepidarius]